MSVEKFKNVWVSLTPVRKGNHIHRDHLRPIYSCDGSAYPTATTKR